MIPLTVGAYYYPGWHRCRVRDAAYEREWSEWDLLKSWQPQFDGHVPPDSPLGGVYDEADPIVMEEKVAMAVDGGIDQFTFAFYWSRGKRLLQGALDNGFLPAVTGSDFRFSLMWANRMPRKVLPVKYGNGADIDPGRLVHTDPDDFLEFIRFIATRYFEHPNYYHYMGGMYLSIFDTNFFIRQMGGDLAKRAIADARDWLFKNDFGELHLVAIDPTAEFRPILASIGFDSVSHYVFLPKWKGDHRQDYRACTIDRGNEWHLYSDETELPYVPSVSPGWDATPRGCDYSGARRDRYPWSPVVIDNTVDAFQDTLFNAERYVRERLPNDPMIMIASWNEWTESHCVEPGARNRYAYLDCIKRLKRLQ